MKLEHIVKGLKEIPNLIIQSALIAGDVTNAKDQPFEAWLAAITEINPTQIQIYSTDRPVPEAGVEKVEPETLQRLAKEIEKRTGVQVSAYWM